MFCWGNRESSQTGFCNLRAQIRRADLGSIPNSATNKSSNLSKIIHSLKPGEYVSIFVSMKADIHIREYQETNIHIHTHES